MAMICDNCVVGHLYSRVLALSLERQWQCWLSAASGLILSQESNESFTLNF